MDEQNRSRKLQIAQRKAIELFSEVAQRSLIRPGVSEKTINSEVYNLAFELFGIRKYWHKRIVRAGPNTLFPYRENPPDLLVQADDIVFLDFGPIFEDWEADFGRTYVLGRDEAKLKLKSDVERIWQMGRDFFRENANVSAQELYHFITSSASAEGYRWGSMHCGHLIGEFPHENIPRDQLDGFIHATNKTPLRSRGDNGLLRHWILEVHLTLPEKQIGAFQEQLLTIDWA